MPTKNTHKGVPIKISKCPILEAIIEIRFESDLPGDAVFGVLYSAFKDRYPSLESLPILQIPEAVRNLDPNLKYQSNYKLSNDTFICQIGPRVISLVNRVKTGSEYVGGTVFSKEMNFIIGKLEELNVIKKFDRLGIRYLNFFECNIFDKILLKITAPFKRKTTALATETEEGLFTSLLQIFDKSDVKIEGVAQQGSLIDIDTFMENKENSNVKSLKKFIKDGMEIEKKLFFSLLDQEFIDTLVPTYEKI